jgi:hypothetical protein
MRALVVLIVLLLAVPGYAQEYYLLGQADQWHHRAAMPGLVFGSKIVIDEQPCCAGAGAAPAKLSDADVVARLGDRAFRDDRVLKLQLAGGRTLQITDCDEHSGCPDDSVHRHRLAGWWPDKRYYLVHRDTDEERNAYLIREDDGLVLAMAEVPVLSPDRRYGLALDPGLASPRMELLDTRFEPPRLRDITESIVCPGLDRKRPYPGLPPVWLDNTRIVFDNSSFFNGDTRHFRMTMEIAGETLLRWKCDL